MAGRRLNPVYPLECAANINGDALEAHLQALVDYFSLHPQIALAAVFAAALIEALAVVGTFIPGSSIVFVGGMLVGMRALDPVATYVAAVAGAVAGDGISFGLGRRYRERLRTMWPLRSHPALLERGQAYFAARGGRSVFFGRFFGPLRAIVPVAAGMAGMPARRFYVVNVTSALTWAAAHLVPGFVFGASLQLAGAVSSRLALVLLIVAGIAWMAARLVAWALRRMQRQLVAWRERAVAWAGTRSGLMARLVLSLLDPARPESKALLTAAVLLIGGAWLFFGVLEDVLANDPLVDLDRGIYTVLQALRNEWTDSVMVAFTEIGSAVVVIPLVAATALCLAVKRRWRTLGYWLAATGFAELLVAVLKFTIGRARPTAIYSGVERFSFPSGHAAMSIVVYGFLAFLLSRAKPVATKVALALVAATLIALISFSRLYLGVHWFSDVLASLSLGLAWVALLSIAYLNHVRDEPLPALALALVAALTVGLAGSVAVTRYHDADLARYAYRPRADAVVLRDWRGGGWRQLPAARSELGGDAEEPLSVQWAAAEHEVGRILSAQGWRVAPPWSATTTLLWLLPTTSIDQLPALPKFNQGAAPRLTFEKLLSADRRLVIRLWTTPYIVDEPGAGTKGPLWIGMVTTERLRHPAHLVSVVETLAEFTLPARQLAHDVVAGHGAVQMQARGGSPVVLAW